MTAGVARMIPPTINKPLPRLIRSLSSSLTSSPINLAATQKPPLPPASPVLDLCDTERLFSSVPIGSLLRSLAVLYTMSVGPVVDLGFGALQSPAVMRNRAVLAAVRGTVYRHFCGGEDAEEAARTLSGLWESGLRGILYYGAEDAEDNEACDRNLAGLLNTVELPSPVLQKLSFTCVKITAICPLSLLERVSDLLRWEQKHPSFHLPWKSHTLPILSSNSPLYHTPSMPPPLTQTEEHDLQLAHQRLAILCRRCSEANLPLLVHAEYTSVQPAIDYLTYAAALEFNRNDRAIVYGTIQAYLKDSKDRMVRVLEASERMEIPIGFKLVRGAYLTRETQQASSMGAASPIHGSIQETHQCYNECVSIMLERVARGTGSVVLATHNVESGKVAALKAEELGIGKGNRKLQLAQLMGMADWLSLGLRNAGFQVSKCMPFGPVELVMPYLIRRAEENRGFLSGTTMEREMIRKELKRRLKTASLGRRVADKSIL